MAKKTKQYRPKDINQLAKYMMELSTGIIEERVEKEEKVSSFPAEKKKEKKS